MRDAPSLRIGFPNFPLCINVYNYIENMPFRMLSWNWCYKNLKSGYKHSTQKWSWLLWQVASQTSPSCPPLPARPAAVFISKSKLLNTLWEVGASPSHQGLGSQLQRRIKSKHPGMQRIKRGVLHHCHLLLWLKDPPSLRSVRKKGSHSFSQDATTSLPMARSSWTNSRPNRPVLPVTKKPCGEPVNQMKD